MILFRAIHIQTGQVIYVVVDKAKHGRDEEVRAAVKFFGGSRLDDVVMECIAGVDATGVVPLLVVK